MVLQTKKAPNTIRDLLVVVRMGIWAPNTNTAVPEVHHTGRLEGLIIVDRMKGPLTVVLQFLPQRLEVLSTEIMEEVQADQRTFMAEDLILGCMRLDLQLRIREMKQTRIPSEMQQPFIVASPYYRVWSSVCNSLTICHVS